MPNEFSAAVSAAEIPARTRERLQRISTATLTSQLLKLGFRQTFLAGLKPSVPGRRMVGRAYTLRYAPSREDVGFEVEYDNARNLQRIAVESVPPDAVLVVDARSETGAASFGHIIATRMAVRGAGGLVTDGCLRDSNLFDTVAMPVYSRGVHATTSSVAHWPVDLQVPVGCAGVLVIPGDVLVGDDEGVVVIPAAAVDEVAESAAKQEDVEAFALERVRAGEPIADLYPLQPSRRRDYDSWRAAQRGEQDRPS